MAVNLSLFAGAGAQFFTDSGSVLTGGKIYSYAAGTTTPQATYTTSAGNVAHTNPIILNAAGRVASGGEIWVISGVIYKFLLKDSNDVLIATYDNISGNGDPSFVQYTPDANSLLAPGPLTIKSALDQITDEDSGSSVIGFLQSGTSAVATTVQAKLRETVSVKDFGAVGDGAANDTAAIQAALNASTSVYIPNGSYRINSGLTLPAGTTLFGNGYASQLLIGTAGIDAITLSGNNTTVKAIRITGTSPAGDSSEIAIYGDTKTHFAVFECWIEGVNYGIKPDTCTNGRIENNTFSNTTGTTQGTAVLLGADAAFISIVGNSFKNTKFHAVYLSTGTKYCSVVGNVIDSPKQAGINFNTTNLQNTTQFNTVTGNTIYNGARSGIYMVGNTQNNVISNNTINTCGEYGIRLEGNSTYALDKQPNFNTISYNTVGDTTLDAIQCNSGSDNKIIGNTCTNVTTTGISVTTSGAGVGSFSYRNKIIDNIVDTCNRGITLSGGADNTQLSNNTLTNITLQTYYLAAETNTNFQEVFDVDNTDYSTTATAVLKSLTIPGYYLGSSGGIRIRAAGTKTGSAGNKTLNLWWDGITYTFNAAANDTNEWYIDAELFNTTLATQRITWYGFNGATPSQSYETASKGTTANRTVGVQAISAAGDTITQTMFIVERI